ncbi:MAG: glucosamine-6-phosphate deaminase [Verrucomicrobiota bacterium]
MSSHRSERESRERIPTQIFADPGEACRQLADQVAQLIRERQSQNKNAVLGLATGSTPVPFYRELIRHHRDLNLSFKNVVTFNLDEYYGLGPNHRESYHRFMREQLFDHIDVPESQIHIPSGQTPDEEVYESCRQYEEAITHAGGIDLQILGIGRTGHIGFNEPGSGKDSRTRRITLDHITRQDAASDFLGIENVPRFAITMGVGTILDARQIVLMAWGENKAHVVAQSVEGPISDSIPASFLQEHPDTTFLVDQAASKELTRIKNPWLVGPVDWPHALARKAVIWLSEKLGKPILKLIDNDYNENGMADLLTEQGPAYNLNIRFFNDTQHTITGWPGGKPNADDTNRPESATPDSKRILVLSPDPVDAIASMGGTLDRLHEQGHQVTLAFQTSGNLRVPDKEAIRFARALRRIAGDYPGEWNAQAEYASDIFSKLESKGPNDVDPPDVRRLKGLLLRGEARDAAADCGLPNDAVTFLDLPFYEKGRFRRFNLTEDDVTLTKDLLESVKPHRIFATGNLADPSTMQALCFRALQAALASLAKDDTPWLADCRLWLYRGKETPVQPNEIEMAVPMSPDQLTQKKNAINQFIATDHYEAHALNHNRDIAKRYDLLGMAEYEAIETFERGSLTS